MSKFQRNLYFLVNRCDVRIIQLDGNGAHNQIERDDKAELVLLSDDDAFEARQRPACDADPAAHIQVRVWLSIQPLHKAPPKGFHLVIRKLRGVTIETDQVNDTRDLKNTQLVAQRQANEDIAGKQRQIELHPAVSPAANRFIERNKVLDRSRSEFSGYTFLMVRAGVGGIPALLGVVRTQAVLLRIHQREAGSR